MIFEFSNPVEVSEIQIKFQGGFVGKECQLQVFDGEKDFGKVLDFYPDDVNSLQVGYIIIEIVQFYFLSVFSSQTFPVESFPREAKKVKVVFANSTDFFGRITVYKLDVIGKIS